MGQTSDERGREVLLMGECTLKSPATPSHLMHPPQPCLDGFDGRLEVCYLSGVRSWVRPFVQHSHFPRDPRGGIPVLWVECCKEEKRSWSTHQPQSTAIGRLSPPSLSLSIQLPL